MKAKLLILLLLLPVLLNAQTDTTFLEDSAYVYTGGLAYGSVFISEPDDINIWQRNTMHTNSNAGTMMSIGRDNADADSGRMDNSWVMGNLLVNTAGTYLSLHGIMDGYNTIGYKHNKTVDIPLSMVTEGVYTTVHDGSTPTMYNIFKVNYVYGLTNEGQNGKAYYNNTIVSLHSLVGYAIHFSYNNEAPGDPWAVNSDFKNNLVYVGSEGDSIVLFLGSGCVSTFDSDYNTWYCENTVDNKPYFYVQGESPSVIDYEAWQALGFDTNSTIADPDFTDTIDFIPSSRLDYGTDLGSSYSAGLDTSYAYEAGTYPDTAVQNGDWQVGAVIYALDESQDHIYHLDPAGSDSDDGQTQGTAWLTLQKAIEELRPGDTVYIHEGTYTPTDWFGTTHDVYYYVPEGVIDSSPATAAGNSGKVDSVICYMGAPGEDRPTFDFSDSGIDPGANANSCVYMSGVQYVTFKDLIFDGLQASSNDGPNVNAFSTVACANIRYENLLFNNIGGAGIRSFSAMGDLETEYGLTIVYDSTYVVNCDFDSCQDVGGNHGDAIKMDQEDGAYLGVFWNRVTFSADDGLDCSGSSERVFWGNHIFGAGCIPNGNGIGIKSGAVRDSVTEIRGVMAYNFSAFCHTSETLEQSAYNGFGFQTVESYPGDGDTTIYYRANFRIYNNTAYRNDNNFGNALTDDWKPWNLNKYYNNVSLAPRYFQDRWRHSLILEPYTESNNTWYNDGEPYYNNYPNASFTCDSSDFNANSLDSAYILTQLYLPRSADGTLPDMNIMTLVEGSDLLEAGTTTGFSDIEDIPGVPSLPSSPNVGFSGYAADVQVDVTSITISAAGGATTITVSDGTLQMSTAILPVDATTQTVTWSVINGTGSATTNQSGLVTAVTDGTVTVRATAQDGTAIYDDYGLTISNQDVPIPTGGRKIGLSGGRASVVNGKIGYIEQ